MRRLAGVLLFLPGLAGLVLVLIFWLPAGMHVGILLSVCLLCLVCVWGGGKLLQQSAVPGEVVPGGPTVPLLQQERTGFVCPRCGWRINLGQRFCGGCGAALGSVCSQCGAIVFPGFKFCTNCGNRLREK